MSKRIIQDLSSASPWANRLIVLLFLLSLAAGSVGAGALVKLGYPLGAICLAVMLSTRDPAGYVRLLLWSMFVTPGLRHYIEWHTGFSRSDPIMLTSYLIVFASLPSVLLHLLNGRRHTFEFLTLILLILAGTGIALISGDVFGALQTAAAWLVPPLLGVYLCSQANSLPRIRRSVLSTFMLGLPVLSIYGIIQFVDIQPWDIYYMKMAPINSIGYPVPFQVRVFGLSNVPGILAATLSTGILLLLPQIKGLRWLIILVSAPALLLTTQRAAMTALVLAILVIIMIGRDKKLVANVGKAVVGIVGMTGLLFALPGAAKKITGVANSLANLQQDGSAQARWDQYEHLFALLDANKIGRGLAWETNSANILVGSSFTVDSGLIDIFLGLGVLGGTLFLVVLLALLLNGFRICLRCGAGAVAEFAGAVFGVAQLPMGSQHVGEPGIFIFLCIGLLLARSMSPQATTQTLRTQSQSMQDLLRMNHGSSSQSSLSVNLQN
ncbi:MAG: O-antigen ligase family protein [Janthinobacterium lividum]